MAAQRRVAADFAAVCVVCLLGCGSTTSADSPVATRVAPDGGFAGDWDTEFGLLTLRLVGKSLQGEYPSGTLRGEVRSFGNLVFDYRDPSERGEGWFKLSADGKSFVGQWRPRGSKQWGDWNGAVRVIDPAEVAAQGRRDRAARNEARRARLEDRGESQEAPRSERDPVQSPPTSRRRVFGAALRASAGGVQVTRTLRGSIAERAGVESGDLIIRFNGRDVVSARDLQDLIDGARGAILVEVSRDGETLRLTAAFAPSDDPRTTDR